MGDCGGAGRAWRSSQDFFFSFARTRLTVREEQEETKVLKTKL